MLPLPVLNLLTNAFPNLSINDIMPTVGGFSHCTAIVTINGQQWVIKLDDASAKRTDIRHEARMLAHLRDSGLPVPALYTLVEDATWTVEIMRAIAGTNGVHFFTDDPDELGSIYSALGHLLATVHRTDLEPPLSDLSLGKWVQRVLQALPTLSLEPDLEAVLEASLANPIWQSPHAYLVHGDAGIHNILWDGRITALLDWEWASWGNPLLDLSWIFWTMRWRNVPHHLWQKFLDSYGSGPAVEFGGTAQEIRALVFGQMAGILVRVKEQPAAWQEWLRRVRWTLDLDFPTIGARHYFVL